jgi:hypothetical protein
MRRFARHDAMVLGGLLLTTKLAFTGLNSVVPVPLRHQIAIFVILVTVRINHSGNNKFRRVNF